MIKEKVIARRQASADRATARSSRTPTPRSSLGAKAKSSATPPPRQRTQGSRNGSESDSPIPSRPSSGTSDSGSVYSAQSRHTDNTTPEYNDLTRDQQHELTKSTQRELLRMRQERGLIDPQEARPLRKRDILDEVREGLQRERSRVRSLSRTQSRKSSRVPSPKDSPQNSDDEARANDPFKDMTTSLTQDDLRTQIRLGRRGALSDEDIAYGQYYMDSGPLNPESELLGTRRAIDKEAMLHHLKSNPRPRGKFGEIQSDVWTRLADELAEWDRGIEQPSSREDYIRCTVVLYGLLQKTEQQGWIHINDLGNGILETDKYVVCGSMNRTPDNKPGGLTSLRCWTPEIRDAIFAILDGKPGCGDKAIMCVPASRAAIASKSEDWDFKLRTGRTPHYLLHCPQIIIDHDEGRYRNQPEDWCWFCGGYGHRVHSCQVHRQESGRDGRYYCPRCQACNHHHVSICKKPAGVGVGLRDNLYSEKAPTSRKYWQR